MLFYNLIWWIYGFIIQRIKTEIKKLKLKSLYIFILKNNNKFNTFRNIFNFKQINK